MTEYAVTIIMVNRKVPKGGSSCFYTHIDGREVPLDKNRGLPKYLKYFRNFGFNDSEYFINNLPCGYEGGYTRNPTEF